MPYNRMAAITYAGAFFNRVCHDGKLATRAGYPSMINGVKLAPGLPLTYNVPYGPYNVFFTNQIRDYCCDTPFFPSLGSSPVWASMESPSRLSPPPVRNL